MGGSEGNSGGFDSLDLLPSRLMRHAAEQTDTVLFSGLDDSLNVQQSWTFGDLDHHARSIAAHLQQRGHAGEPVVIAHTSGIDFAAAFMGCLYAGAIAVPTPLPRMHGIDERMTLIIADSGARTVLTAGRHVAPIERLLEESSLSVEVLGSEALPDISSEWVPREWQADSLAFLQYTSGSTRSPRGVMVSHGNLAANLQTIHDLVGTHAKSISVGWLPLFHDMGLIAGLLEPMWVGYPAFIMTPSAFLQSPLRWLQAISRYRGTVSGGPNFAYQACVDAAATTDISDLDLTTWEVAANGAEPVRASTVEAFARTFAAAGFRPEAMAPAFGLAEATLMVTSNVGASVAPEIVVDETDLRNGIVTECSVESPAAKRLVGSGRAHGNTSVRIVESDTRNEVAPGRVGEIWVQNDCIGQGYWGKPEESESLFRARLTNGDGPFLRTGDLGFIRDGQLFVTGRIKDVIVIRGANYYPHDIEHTVESSHPALRPDAGAVIGFEEHGDVRLVAVQEIRRDSRHTVNPDEVFDAVRRAVAREHQLALDGVVLLKPFSLPKTTSGKIQRSETRAALAESRLQVMYEWSASAVPAAPIDFNGEPLQQPGVLERQLVDWLKSELSLNELSWQTPLMELGIDSLKGVELGTALSKAFDHSFSTTLLIDYPTIEALAGLIRSEVLGVPVNEPVTVASSSAVMRTEEILALGEDELDAMLLKSIEDVLKSGGRG